MKSLVAFILLTLSSVSFSAEYQCFSYQTGKQVIANSDTGVIILKDRFGNELDVIDDVTMNIRILATIPETTEVLFVKENDTVMVIQEQGEFIRGVFSDDESYRCRTRKIESISF